MEQISVLDHGLMNSLVDIPGVLVGHYSHPDVLRGSTAVLFPEGALASVSVRGSNPVTLVTDGLAATTVDMYINGISLSGGSLFGLSPAVGITEWCQEHGIGLRRFGVYLPVIPGAVIYDFRVADPRVHPTPKWGYLAAEAARGEAFQRGNVGAGRGGTAGKGKGTVPVKGGLGTSSLVLPDGIVVAALAVVNSLGSPIDPITGQLYAREGGFDHPYYFESSLAQTEDVREGNTTLGIIATNCMLTKTQLAKIADLAHDGFARVFRPMHTMLDGDTIFSVSVGGENRISPDLVDFQVTDLIGALAADAMVLALIDALMQAESIPGFPACRKVLAGFREKGE